jgi:glutamate 5-kinase
MRNFQNIKRIIIKVGSSSLVKSDYSVNMPMLVTIMHEFSNLKKKGIDVALVTSGAIAVGMNVLGLEHKPKDMALKQACAAVGQAKLMEAYKKAAEIYIIKLGQILVNHDDFQVRKRMLYLSNTLDSMFKNNIVPVINENDALAVEEIKVGDNDTLAALIAPMVDADLLVLFSDIDGLYTKYPKVYKDAVMVDIVDKIDSNILSMVSGSTTNVGTGGMETKIDAALISTMVGVNMIICNSNKLDSLIDIAEGKNIGTLFKAQEKGISSREHWMIFKANSQGAITVDNGVKELLEKRKVSILPKGITKVDGEFLSGSVIDIISVDGIILAKGITNHSSSEIDSVKGKDSKTADSIIDFHTKKGIVYADDMVILKEGYYGRFVK